MKNFTPHTVVILTKDGVEFDPKTRKYQLVGEPVKLAELPSEGVLSAKFEDVDSDPIEGIPTKKRTLIGCDPLPEGDDYLVVSLLYAQALKETGVQTNRLLTVGDPVYQDGKIVGALCLIRV